MTVNSPLVIDIYHGDNVIDFAKVKASGIVAVFHKASQGSANPARFSCNVSHSVS